MNEKKGTRRRRKNQNEIMPPLAREPRVRHTRHPPKCNAGPWGLFSSIFPINSPKINTDALIRCRLFRYIDNGEEKEFRTYFWKIHLHIETSGHESIIQLFTSGKDIQSLVMSFINIIKIISQRIAVKKKYLCFNFML